MSPKEFVKLFVKWSGKEYDEVVIQRNQYLIRSGQVEKYLYLITEGALIATYLHEEEELTVRLGYKNSVITSLDSFITGKCAQFSLVAIKKTRVIRLEKDTYLDFITSGSDVNIYHNQIMNGLLVSMLNREIDLLTSSPKKRYERVLERSPQVFQEIPLKYIASYLRMKPETLSRLRKS